MIRHHSARIIINLSAPKAPSLRSRLRRVPADIKPHGPSADLIKSPLYQIRNQTKERSPFCHGWMPMQGPSTNSSLHCPSFRPFEMAFPRSPTDQSLPTLKQTRASSRKFVWEPFQRQTLLRYFSENHIKILSRSYGRHDPSTNVLCCANKTARLRPQPHHQRTHNHPPHRCDLFLANRRPSCRRRPGSFQRTIFSLLSPSTRQMWMTFAWCGLKTVHTILSTPIHGTDIGFSVHSRKSWRSTKVWPRSIDTSWHQCSQVSNWVEKASIFLLPVRDFGGQQGGVWTEWKQLLWSSQVSDGLASWSWICNASSTSANGAGCNAVLDPFSRFFRSFALVTITTLTGCEQAPNCFVRSCFAEHGG